MRKFWLVWNGRGWSDAREHMPRHEHATRESADAEAQRLARLVPGSRFFVLEALRYWEKDDVKVVDLTEPQRDPITGDVLGEYPF